MGGKNLLRELIDHYLEFVDSNHEQDLAGFAEWLQDRTRVEDKLEPHLQSEISNKGLVLAIAEHWGRLSQFTAVWGKMAFQSLPINTFAEYGLLKVTAELNIPTKTDLVEMSMLEKSTCYEIIRRLQQLELIEEKKDQQDKRIRRVKLTAEGEKWIKQGDEQLAKIARVLVGDLNRKNQSQLLGMLLQLNNFHARLYQQDHQQVRRNYF